MHNAARPPTTEELSRLRAACDAVPEAEGDYIEHDYITNIVYTVLDLMMHGNAVAKALTFFREHRSPEMRTLDDLERLLASQPDTKDGNLAVAQYLWNYNLWTRVEWLRGFVAWLWANNLTDQESLRAWAHTSRFHDDFEGQVPHLGIAAYKWLTMRLGVETVKPDVHLHRFVANAVGHPVTDDELIRALEEVAVASGRSALKLDWAIWEYQRSQPVTAGASDRQ